MGADGNKRFDGVGQGVHPGCGGDGWRNIQHYAGVIHGDIRMIFGSIITSLT
jgi:hypothetical protein